ncbi:hypothetical protein [Bosea sp. (in: a-proteobacteria)]|uniref:hypothetical protein n=1 Tax=Bosea sp. (in: a-proteobacteria) TaxID=1871050 RepID=UPI002FC5EF9B
MVTERTWLDRPFRNLLWRVVGFGIEAAQLAGAVLGKVKVLGNVKAEPRGGRI